MIGEDENVDVAIGAFIGLRIFDVAPANARSWSTTRGTPEPQMLAAP